MSITAVLTTRAKSGRYQRVREGMGELKDILAKNGVNVRLTHPLTGDHQGDLSLVSEYDGWAAFGKTAEKIQSSKEYVALMDRAAKAEDSAVESMSTIFYSDVE
jgi:hypothetical protein